MRVHAAVSHPAETTGSLNANGCLSTSDNQSKFCWCFVRRVSLRSFLPQSFVTSLKTAIAAGIVWSWAREMNPWIWFNLLVSGRRSCPRHWNYNKNKLVTPIHCCNKLTMPGPGMHVLAEWQWHCHFVANVAADWHQTRSRSMLLVRVEKIAAVHHNLMHLEHWITMLHLWPSSCMRICLPSRPTSPEYSTRFNMLSV